MNNVSYTVLKLTNGEDIICEVDYDEDVKISDDESGKVSVPLTQFGGRFGKDIDGNDLDDDFISKDGPELKLHVEWEKQPNNMFKVVANIQ